MRWHILSVVAALYTVQYIPFFFTVMALPIIMRSEGHSATTIGLIQLVALPYVFKFLWAPLIDRFSLGRERYKSWIVALSVFHLSCIAMLAMMDPSGSIVPLMVALFLASLAISTQDVAVDALTIALLRPSERGLGATFQTFGAHVGGVIGGFGFLYIYDTIGWTVALLFQCVIFAVPLFSLRLIDEPPRLRGVPQITFRNAMRFFIQPRILPWLGILSTLRLPLILTLLPMRIMMVDQGMTTEEIALWFGLFAMSAAGGATALLGPLLRHLPRVQALYVVGVMNIPVLIGVVYLATVFPDQIRFAIIIAWVAISLIDVVIFRSAMDKVRPEMPGFDFSAQIGIYVIIGLFADPLIGLVIDTYGYLPAFYAALPAALVPIAILWIFFAHPRNSGRGLDGERSRVKGTMRTDKAAAFMAFCAEETELHGIPCTWPEPGLLRIEEMGCLVEFQSNDNTLEIRIDTPNDNFMNFVRDDIVEHLEEFDLSAARSLRWTGDMKAGERPSNFYILYASRRRQIHSGLIRVTLEGADVDRITKDGIHLRLMMPSGRTRKPVWPVVAENGRTVWPQGDDKLHSRYVTIRNIRRDAREIDVDITCHGAGLISDWAAHEGDDREVAVMGPMGDSWLKHTENVVLAADSTGLPAVARLVESVGGQVTGHLFAAVPDQAALDKYVPNSKLKLVALSPAAFDREIADRIRSCTNAPVSYGWFAGEFTTAQAVRRVFEEDLGLGKRSQLSVAYWKSGAPGHKSRAL